MCFYHIIYDCKKLAWPAPQSRRTCTLFELPYSESVSFISASSIFFTSSSDISSKSSSMFNSPSDKVFQKCFEVIICLVHFPPYIRLMNMILFLSSDRHRSPHGESKRVCPRLFIICSKSQRQTPLHTLNYVEIQGIILAKVLEHSSSRETDDLW